MKYSLRSLMIGMTVACLALGRVAYLGNLATHHEREREKIVLQLVGSDTYFPADERPTAEAISDEISWMADGDDPVYVGHFNIDALAIRRNGYGFNCYEPATMDTLLSAVHRQRCASAYRHAQWTPWQLVAEPSKPHVIHEKL